MNARLPRLAPLVLLLTTLSPAQTYLGEAPTLFRPLAMDPTMAPASFGFASIEGMACRRQPNGDYYFGLCGRQTRTSPSRLVAWRRNGTTGAWTRLSHFDATAQDGDQHVTFTADLLFCAVFTGGVGMRVCQRPTIDAPWGPRQAINGMPADAYSPSFATIGGPLSQGRDAIVYCTSTPPMVYAGEFERFSLRNANPYRLVNPPGPGIHFTSASAVDDPSTGETKRVVFGQRTNAGLQQRWAITANLKSLAPDLVLFDSPRNNVLVNFAQLSGGSFRASCVGIPGLSQFPDSVLDIDLVFPFDASASGTGQLDMTVCGPQRDGGNPYWGLLLIGVLGNAGIPIPGLGGKLGLAPSPIVILPSLELLAVEAYVSYRALVPSGVHGTANIQGGVYDSLSLVLGGTSTIRF